MASVAQNVMASSSLSVARIVPASSRSQALAAQFAPLPLRQRAHARAARAVRCAAERDALAKPVRADDVSEMPSFLTSAEAAFPPAAASPPTSSLAAKLGDTLKGFFGQALKPALVTLLVTALLWYVPNMAMAAQSGGRTGGSNFSASRSRTYSAPSRSYSAPSYRAPAVGPSYSAPFFFAPSPFFFPSFGPTVYIGGGGGGSFFNLIFFGIIAWFAVSTILNFWGSNTEEELWEASQRSSVVRLQVGLMGTARQLQKDLEKMATRADTNSPEGLHYVLQESVLALLRNPDYCIYGYSTSEVTRDSYEGEQAFNRLSMEERSKFKEETLVNVGDVRRRKDSSSLAGGLSSEYIVVTIIAATEGEFRLPEIRSNNDLRNALTTLGSITAEELQAVEILWTPEDENDTLTTKDLLQDYPLLRPL